MVRQRRDRPDLSNLDVRFFEAAPHPDVFDFNGENLAKLFLDDFCARRFAASGPGWAPRRSERTPKALLIIVFRLLRGTVKLLAAKWLGVGRRKVAFLGAHGRTIDEGGRIYDLYNCRVVESVGRENCLILESISDNLRKEYSPDLLIHDFVIPRIIRQILLRPKLRQFVMRLTSTCPGLGLTERDVYQIVSKYLAQKAILRGVLRAWGIEKAIIICHYGREAFTAACKSLRIETAELMHGEIFPSILNYCLRNPPPGYRDALMNSSQTPDRLGLFGPLWLEIIRSDCYFPPEGLTVAGYYLRSKNILPALPGPSKKAGMSVKKMILISTQSLYQDELAEYVYFLRKRLDKDKWKVVIKVHPNENGTIYAPLAEAGFIEISHKSVYRWLGEADIHIGATSTVVFEAVMYGLPNYVIDIPWEEKIDEIVATGAARRLKMNEIPQPYPVDPDLKNKLFAEYKGISNLFSS